MAVEWLPHQHRQNYSLHVQFLPFSDRRSISSRIKSTAGKFKPWFIFNTNMLLASVGTVWNEKIYMYKILSVDLKNNAKSIGINR